MDENSAEFEAILKDIERASSGTSYTTNDDHEWKTVSYKKSKRKPTNKASENHPDHGSGNGDVFWSIEQQSEDRRRRVVESLKAATAAIDAAADDAPHRAADNDVEEDGSDVENLAGPENGKGEVKKSKPKKLKKPKVTVAEAASKINDSDLAVFLADITESYDSQPDIRLMRFADYFGRAFASVTASQFPWMKTLKEASVEKMIDIPLSHISEDVYRTSADWLNLQPVDALGSFVVWSLDSIIADLALHQVAVKGSKKIVQQAPSKSQVAIFVVLAMVLRRKPDVLIGLVPIIKDSSKYQGPDKLSVLVWTITQACQGDLVVGLFMWAHLLLPIVSSKLGNNPQSRDLILQLVERIVSSPKARTILVNGAVRKGERVVPPSALELLMVATFPTSSRIKATERFEAVYPLLKEVALAVAPGSKAMKQLTHHFLPVAAKSAGQGNSGLANEASDIFLWCLTQNPDCYKQWDDIYLDNLKASIMVLKKLSDEWKMYSEKHSTFDPLKATLKSFRDKNDKALTGDNKGSEEALVKDADKYCKIILSKFSRGNHCFKATVFLTITMAVGLSLVIKDHGVLKLKEIVDFDLFSTFTSFAQ